MRGAIRNWRLSGQEAFGVLKSNISIYDPIAKQVVEILDQMSKGRPGGQEFFVGEMAGLRAARPIKISWKGQAEDPTFRVFGQPDAQGTVCDVVPELTDRSESDKELCHRLLLLPRVICLTDMFLDALDAVLKVTIPELGKFLGRQG